MMSAAIARTAIDRGREDPARDALELGARDEVNADDDDQRRAVNVPKNRIATWLLNAAITASKTSARSV